MRRDWVLGVTQHLFRLARAALARSSKARPAFLVLIDTTSPAVAVRPARSRADRLVLLTCVFYCTASTRKAQNRCRPSYGDRTVSQPSPWLSPSDDADLARSVLPSSQKAGSEGLRGAGSMVSAECACRWFSGSGSASTWEAQLEAGWRGQHDGGEPVRVGRRGAKGVQSRV